MEELMISEDPDPTQTTLVLLVTLIGPFVVSWIKSRWPDAASGRGLELNALVTCGIYAVLCLAFGFSDFSQSGILVCLGQGLAMTTVGSGIAGGVKRQIKKNVRNGGASARPAP